MMASSSELSLDYKPHSYSSLLKSFGEQIDQTQKLEEFLCRLEEERVKIDAFKRELPLCMQLLTNAMEASRQQLQSYRSANQSGQRPPVLEEFIPLKNNNSNSELGIPEKASNISDKANWMTSAQLWSQPSSELAATRQQSTVILTSDPSKETDTGFKQRNGNPGAFLPFTKDRSSSSNSSSQGGHHGLRALSDLALCSGADKDNMIMEDKKCHDNDSRKENNNDNNNNKGVINTASHENGKGGHVPTDSQNTNNNNSNSNNTQTHRKARRCWSPDLHRRFVNALQMLGGSQVATPKQIRELMKVDGLTNDEVKSHLQKYRLHTRRPSPSPQAAATATPPLVVLGGIWVSPEYATAAAAAAAAAAHGGAPPTLYGTHPTAHAHASAHYCAPPTVPVSQEFFQATAQPQPHHQLHHPFHRQLHMFKPSSQTNGSPESNVQGTRGDRSESIEDGKSESGSWKADSSGENGGERKALVIREEGEESNGSEITLKF